MKAIQEKVLGDEEYTRSLRRKLHQQPELSGQERLTTDLIARELESLGLKVTVWPGEPGVTAVLRGAHAGKTLALRADMDALPLTEASGLPFASVHEGIAHACGHDIHMAVLLGTARILKSLQPQLCGNVKFIFQPAEEQLNGAKLMIERGVLNNPEVDHILALHCWPDIPAGSVGVKSGAFMASSDSVRVIVKGQAGHAAHPHRCVDAVVGAAAIVGAVQTIVSRETAPADATVITFGSIHGGTAANIVASRVELLGTVRTVNAAVRNALPAMLARVVDCTAKAYRCTGEVIWQKGTPPVVNHSELVELVEKTAVQILGDKQVIRLEQASMGSEDFAFYMEKIPGVIFRLGTAGDAPQSKLALHNPEIIFDEAALSTGIAVLSATAAAYLCD